MIRTLKILIAIFLVFLLHRVEAWGSLSEQYNGQGGSLRQEAVTGLLSDAWMATVLSLPFWVFEFFPNKKSRSAQKLLGTLWVLLIGGLTAGHQGYVEFFKFQIIPFHLSYMFDQSFVSANGATMFNTNSTLIFSLSAGLAIWVRRSKKIKQKRRVATWLAGVLLAAITFHVLNIRWRVNWFVIEPLQANYMEALYSNLQKKPSLRAIAGDELAVFNQKSGQKDPLIPNAGEIPEGGYLGAIKTAIASRRSDSKPVILGLIVSESFRDIDTGPRPSDGKSITPTIDILRETGVKFTNVYSSGPVTRGGQEAAWCGTPSATDTSLMRSFPDLPIKCLPAELKDQQKIETLWAHGGDERFDSQLSFWKRQAVKNFILKADFPAEAPRTGWGISDLAIFDRAAQTLKTLSEKPGTEFILPMILTVTNHIPWALPEDASIDTKNFVAKHESHKTIKYFDEALDLFVTGLKEKGLWENAIFIITGDHGNLELPWSDRDLKDPLRWERRLSHVSVTLTGGIIERLRKDEKLPGAVNIFTAQNQIAPFLALLADGGSKQKKVSSYMDLPLFEKSPWPVASDLNQYLFLPESGIKLPKEDVLAGKISRTDGQAWLAATRYRAWLQFLYSKTAKH